MNVNISSKTDYRLLSKSNKHELVSEFRHLCKLPVLSQSAELKNDFFELHSSENHDEERNCTVYVDSTNIADYTLMSKSDTSGYNSYSDVDELCFSSKMSTKSCDSDNVVVTDDVSSSAVDGIYEHCGSVDSRRSDFIYYDSPTVYSDINDESTVNNDGHANLNSDSETLRSTSSKGEIDESDIDLLKVQLIHDISKSVSARTVEVNAICNFSIN